MVFITPLIGAAALFSGFVSALPMPDHHLSSEAPAAASYESSSYEASSYEAPKYESSYDSAPAYEAPKAEASSSEYAPPAEHTPAPVEHTTAAVEHTTAAEAYTTSEAAAWTTTTAAAESYATPSYGSGSDNWGAGYDDCVQQCLATYGGLSTGTYAPTATAPSEGSVGTGATHTVIVAPTQGVLRFVPFVTNASVGDTIMFMWGANNHTVTKSSSLTPCNKTADALFASGTQNKDFVFTQVVNDTNPTFYYCATPGHCGNGMYGIINPPNAADAAKSVGGMMKSVAESNADVKAYAAYTNSKTEGTSAYSWGSNLDVSSMPEWAQPSFMENVLYTRNLLAANPDVLQEGGAIDLSSMSSTPLMIPDDVTTALNAAAADGSATDDSVSAPAASSTSASDATPSSDSESQNAPGAYNGAGSLASSKMLVGVVAVFATFMLL